MCAAKTPFWLLRPGLLAALRRPLTRSYGAGVPGGGTIGTNAKHDFNITPSRHQWNKFKDRLVLWIALIGGPVLGFMTYINVTVGPARLVPIPEGYEPKDHEYYSHPITRLIRKYILKTQQERYEQMLHDVWEEKKKYYQSRLEKEVHRLMRTEGDYKGYYHVDHTASFLRRHRNVLDELQDRAGQVPIK